MASAFKVADRILMLHRGAFIADGTADDIRNSNDPHVKRFVAGDADLDVDAMQA
jgi:phospholipid/cholesterol/gamma-HCH transport system ATP-binding protein